ncbi:MAG: hypothetical protein V3U90_03260 [Dehalococcoidia bacterium]
MAPKMDKAISSKTVMLAVWDGFGARLLLRTGIFSTLKGAGLRLVILCPNPEEEYFLREFQDDRVLIERLEVEKCLQRFRDSPPQRFFKGLRTFTLSSEGDLSSVDALLRLRLIDHNTHPLHRGILRAIIPMLRKSKSLRKGLLGLESSLAQGNLHTSLFQKYRPDLLIATTLGTNPVDAYLLREAKQWGVKTAVVIQNWDQPDRQGYRGAEPDSVIAWGEAMKEELVKGHDLPNKAVFIGGIPHFDTYSSNGALPSYKDFCARFGLVTERRILLFGTNPPQSYPYNADIVDILAEAINQEVLSAPCQLLVRLHPKHFAGREGPLDSATLKALLDRYEQIRQKCPYVVYHSPQVLSTRLDLDLPKSDMLDLAAMIKYANVVITGFSTLNLESFICDVPVVNIAFDGYRKRRLGYERRGPMARYLYFGWIRRTLALQSCRVAYSRQELIKHVNHYLENPELDSKGRMSVVSRECGLQDGHAGERIGQYLLKVLEP